MQSFIRDDMGNKHRFAWSRFAVEALAYAFPVEVDDSATWPICESLVNHVTTAIELADYETWDDEMIEALFSSAGSYLHARGRADQALSLLEKARDLSVSRYGDNNPSVAGTMNNLLTLLFEVGRSEEALKLGERAIEILTQDEESMWENADVLGKVYSNLVWLSPALQEEFPKSQNFCEHLGFI